MRSRPGIVTHTTFATVPEQRRTASLRSRCTASGTRNVLILAPMGLDPAMTEEKLWQASCVRGDSNAEGRQR